MTARRVLVTGGSRGIGKAIAAAFAAEGHEVITPARNQLDLASTASVQKWLQGPDAKSIDVLINNAGENKVAPLEKVSLADFERTLTVNLTSSFLLTQALGPAMAARGWGRIVNLSSIYSNLARPGRAPYSSSKSGLNGLMRTAAVEWGPQGVLVNAVCPGFVETEMTRQNNDAATLQRLADGTALKRLAKPEEIAQLVLFLGGERNTYLTGQMITADGGFSIQ